MVTEHGEPVPPPGDRAEAETLDRIWSKVSVVTAARWRTSLHTRRARAGAGAVLAILLFGGGVAVGGAALAPLTTPTPAFTISCYSSVTATTTSVNLSYTTENDAAVARSNPVNACARVQTLTTVENGVDELVRHQIAQGHSCGAIHFTDGTTWSFIDDPTNGLSVMSATPATPLGPNCVQLQNVQPPTVTTQQQFACTVNDHQVDVYPGDPKTAATVCASKGLTPAA